MNNKTLNLEQDEVVLFKVRRHWFLHAMEVTGIAIVALLPVFLYTVAFTMLSAKFTFPTHHVAYFIIFETIWLICCWMALFSIWTNYYLDIWTLTNKRFVAVDQRGFFSRKVASFPLERLQDVIISVHGVLPTLLKYGTIEIQTAGEENNFKAHGIPDPEALKAKILGATGMVTKL
jgi:uncharacterized membrane protein YdbT with pleckstrin-like domain